MTRTVHITTKNDRTFRGVLWADRGRFVVLKKASLLEVDAVKELDGEVIIERDNIDFVQVVT